MGIFNNEVIIDKDNIFENDKLKRQDEIIRLTSIIEAVDNQMVLAINSEWGTGKTTFLKMWKQSLENDGYKTVFFNSWENDFSEDPFVSFIGEINKELGANEFTKDLIEASKPVVMSILKSIPGMLADALKNKTGVDLTSIKFDEIAENYISNKLDDYNKDKESATNFKEELKKFSTKIYENTEKPLIIFVDELDRCRPDFAIKLLERVKHYFNIENIIFILGVDKEALSNSIKVVYGEGTDINGYLTRFIDMEYKLNINSKQDYVAHLMQKYKIAELMGREQLSPKACFGILNMLNLELRDIEKILINFTLFYKINCRKSVPFYQELVLFLIGLRYKNIKIYNQIKTKNIKMIELEGILNNYNASAFSENKLIVSIIKCYLIKGLNDEEYIENIERNLEIADKNSLERYLVNKYNEYKNTGYKYSDIDEWMNSIYKSISFYEELY